MPTAPLYTEASAPDGWSDQLGALLTAAGLCAELHLALRPSSLAGEAALVELIRRAIPLLLRLGQGPLLLRVQAPSAGVGLPLLEATADPELQLCIQGLAPPAVQPEELVRQAIHLAPLLHRAAQLGASAHWGEEALILGLPAHLPGWRGPALVMGASAEEAWALEELLDQAGWQPSFARADGPEPHRPSLLLLVQPDEELTELCSQRWPDLAPLLLGEGGLPMPLERGALLSALAALDLGPP